MRHGDPPEGSTTERGISATLTQRLLPQRGIHDQNRKTRTLDAKISLPPMAASWSMIALMPRRGTKARTATQSGSASGAIVGDSNPGVIATASSRTEGGQS